jgi:hypothetical protein
MLLALVLYTLSIRHDALHGHKLSAVLRCSVVSASIAILLILLVVVDLVIPEQSLPLR